MVNENGPPKRIFANFSFIISVDPTLWQRISRFLGQQNPIERFGQPAEPNIGVKSVEIPNPILPTRFVVDKDRKACLPRGTNFHTFNQYTPVAAKSAVGDSTRHKVPRAH